VTDAPAGNGVGDIFPQAELHVHIEATAPPALLRRLAARNGAEVPEDVMAWTDFLDFLRRYDIAARAFRSGEDYREATEAYLTACRDGGAIYVELIVSPDHARNQGIPAEEHLEGIAAGIDAVDGIDARLVLTGLRHLGPEAVLRAARYAATRPHPYVVGFNLAGDEAGFPASLFHDAYAVAHDAGLGCTVHAGEGAVRSPCARASRCPG
jgi:adenosine deaminase